MPSLLTGILLGCEQLIKEFGSHGIRVFGYSGTPGTRFRNPSAWATHDSAAWR
jgi:hypothetical protein